MDNKEYWQDRVNKIYDENIKEKATKKIYKESYNRAEIATKELWLKLHNNKKLTRTELYQFSDFLKLRRTLKKESINIYSHLNKQIYKSLVNAYKETFKSTKYLFGKDMKFNMVNKKLMETCLQKDWSGKHYSTRLWGNTDVLSKNLERLVADGILTGKTTEEMVKEITKGFNKSYAQSERLICTELAHTMNQSNIDTYSEEGIEKVKWHVERHGNVCEECKALDEQIFDINDFTSGKMQVIVHPRCRCMQSPHIEITRKTKKEKSLTNGENNGIINLNRQTKNIGAFSELQEKMSKKHIRDISSKYNIDLSGLTLDIDVQEELLKIPYAGSANASKIGEITFMPNAFKDEETLIRTIYHEKTHVEQYKRYGSKHVSDNAERFEKETYAAEDRFISDLKKKGVL